MPTRASHFASPEHVSRAVPPTAVAHPHAPGTGQRRRAGRYLSVQAGEDTLAFPHEQILGVSRLHPLALLPQYDLGPSALTTQALGHFYVPLRSLLGWPEQCGLDSAVIYVASGAAPEQHIGLIVDALPRLIEIGAPVLATASTSPVAGGAHRTVVQFDGRRIVLLDPADLFSHHFLNPPSHEGGGPLRSNT